MASGDAIHTDYNGRIMLLGLGHLEGCPGTEQRSGRAVCIRGSSPLPNDMGLSALVLIDEISPSVFCPALPPLIF